MNSVNERLRLFVEKKNLDQTEVAKQLKVSKQRINGWLTETSIPMYVLGEILRLFPDLDARWLLTGQYSTPGENPLIVNEPALPYNHACTNPACIKEIENLHQQVEDLRADKIFLQETIKDLRRKVGPSSENTNSGSVEEPVRRTG